MHSINIIIRERIKNLHIIGLLNIDLLREVYLRIKCVRLIALISETFDMSLYPQLGNQKFNVFENHAFRMESKITTAQYLRNACISQTIKFVYG